MWTHRTDWRRTLDFGTAVPGPDERVDLVFDGLDTVTTVELNGIRLGTTATVHRSHRFDVRRVLREGSNPLVVDFRSVLDPAPLTRPLMLRSADDLR
ncbi:hypothetical protein [Peterkaempfera sp. SMS 1(5)a]|uniref:glycosyl hydrolase 2 galactose-binding domain-containing protein n=1 Tax=Peterkaempfera podocarpi TaxID=3232308 RepID=UPI003672CECB